MGLLGMLTLVVVGATAYGFVRQGIVFGATAAFSALLAGMVSFQLWPTVAPEVKFVLGEDSLKGWEDAIAMIVVFVLVFAGIFMGALVIGKHEFGFSAKVDQVGSIFFGGLTAYLTSGFLLCAIQTLPIREHFLGFSYDENGFAHRVLPADQVWLKLMHRSHRGVFSSGDDHSQMLQEFSKTFAHERRKSKTNTEPPPPAEPETQKIPDTSDAGTLTPGKKDISP